jgi:hypothetical protein
MADFISLRRGIRRCVRCYGHGRASGLASGGGQSSPFNSVGLGLKRILVLIIFMPQWKFIAMSCATTVSFGLNLGPLANAPMFGMPRGSFLEQNVGVSAANAVYRGICPRVEL